MVFSQAAQAMQGPSHGSVHNRCASLTLFSVGTFFDWEGGGGGGGTLIIWAVKKQVVRMSTQKVGWSVAMLSPRNFFYRAAWRSPLRLFINPKWVQSYL